MNAMELRSLSAARGGRTILSDISLDVPAGSLVAIVGPNGAGKTTLLRAMCGLDQPLRGEVLLGDQTPLSSLPARVAAERIAWVPQDSSLPFAFTVSETVLLGRFPSHQGHPGSRDRVHASAAMEVMGLKGFEDRIVPTLSTGERQKVMLARALALGAPLLFLDEPCASLDIGAALELMETLRNLVANGTTVCLSLHDLNLVRRFATHTLVLADGRSHGFGATSDILTPTVVGQVFGPRARAFFQPG
jgi:iron complex transport system ATP-binding protein